jgi:hypothetical protein
VVTVNKLKLTFSAWLSYLSWQLGPARWWIGVALIMALACASLTLYWKHEATLLDAEIESVLRKIKTKKIAQRAGASSAAQVAPLQTTSTGKAIPIGYAASDRESLKLLKLPPAQATKVSPLAGHLSEAKLKGLTLKQLDYVWSKTARAPGQELAIGRIDVNLSMEGNYLAVRAWLGQLLYEEANIQLSAIQFQRIARDSALVNSVMTLSVYFQEVK